MYNTSIRLNTDAQIVAHAMRTKELGVTRVPVLLNAGKQAPLTAPQDHAPLPRSRAPATVNEPDKLGKHTVCPTRCKTARLAGRIMAVPVTAGAAHACKAHRNSIAGHTRPGCMFWPHMMNHTAPQLLPKKAHGIPTLHLRALLRTPPECNPPYSGPYTRKDSCSWHVAQARLEGRSSDCENKLVSMSGHSVATHLPVSTANGIPVHAYLP